jgi:hypothetical protein
MAIPYKAMKNALKIPGHFLKTLHEQEYADRYYEWKYGLPDKWISNFISNGLVPFLNERGYSLGLTEKIMIAYCIEWGFAHCYTEQKKAEQLNINFLKCCNTGGDDELEWYQFQIPFEEWEDLADAWQVTEFLDTSDAGISQRNDLPFFAWNLIRLESSKTHHKWLSILDNGDYSDDDGPHNIVAYNDDSIAYGGDRRTL